MNKEIKESKTRFNDFMGSEINNIALSLEQFNKKYKGILNQIEYENLMKEIKTEEKIRYEEYKKLF
jgi:ribosome maturation factor RimP